MLAILAKKGYNRKSIKRKEKSGSKNPALISWLLKGPSPNWQDRRKVLAKIEEKIESLVKEKIEKLGYELYDVLYLKEGANKILRIVIDQEKGISLDDCEKVNNAIKDLIDEADYIEEQYYLEISSPGIERILRKDWQLKKFIGEEVEIKLFKKDDKGNKSYIGTLLTVTDENLEIDLGEKIKIARKNIAQVKTVYRD